MQLETSEKKTTISDYLDKMCSYYMSLGCSLNDFWHGDTEHLKFYYEKHMLEMNEKNFFLWLSGQYTMQATHGDKNGKLNYPKEPFRIIPETQEEKDERLRHNLYAFISSLEQKSSKINNTAEVICEKK